MAATFHMLSAGDERALLESVAEELPDTQFLDRAEDELFRLAQAAKAAGPPADAPAGWDSCSNGVLTAAAMALRTGRAIGLLVSSGYGFEAAGLVRRLGEIAQHAAGCAQDSTGTYARNWGKGAGRAGKPSRAYMHGVEEPSAVRDKWGFLSQMEHADFKPYINFMCSRDQQGMIVHPVAPARHAAVDAIIVSSAAWDLARTAAAVCRVHPDLDDGPTLALATELRSRQAAIDARMNSWVLMRQTQMSTDQTEG